MYKNTQTKSKQKSSYSNGPEVLVCFLFREKDRNLIRFHLEKFALLLLFFFWGGGNKNPPRVRVSLLVLSINIPQCSPGIWLTFCLYSFKLNF